MEKQRCAILALLRARGEHGATDEEMQDVFAVFPFSDDEMKIMRPLRNGNTQRPRRVELAGGGKKKRWPVLIVDSGRTRPTASGCKATVWVVKGEPNG